MQIILSCISENPTKLQFLKKRHLYFRYVTSDDVVEVKGKVACEISSADELTLTELMFSGALKDATVEQMVALLSCFVWQEKLQDAPKPREELDLLFYQLQETARRVANLQLECKVVNATKSSYKIVRE
jgi:superfamily II RNA helicase